MKTLTTKGLKKSITKVILAFLFIFTGMNTYGQLNEVPLEQKIEEAELVVEGEVIESECFRTNGGDIYTAHKLKIYKSFKASPTSEYVSVITRGGILDNEEQTWTHLLTLYTGAKGIFFLHKTASPPYTLEKVTDNYYSVFSSEQGFLKYDWENEMLRAYEPFHQYKNVEKDIFDRLQKDYGKPYQKLANNDWSYTEKTEEVIQTYTTQVKNGDKCLDFLFEIMSPDPNNIFQVTTVVSIKATELTHITRPVIALKYSPTVLGTNIAANNLITLEQIGLSSNINYTSVAQDIAPDKVRIDVQANSLDEPDLFVITDTYTTLIKIHLTLPGPLDPGLLLDQEMMETLSKYFDLEEGIEKYFDCMRIEGDFNTFQCPVAVISGFNATSFNDTTIVFPADSIRAGTDDVLIISGACFGNIQGDSYVEFTNAKRGPNQDEWVKPLRNSFPDDAFDDYLSWSDTEIRVLVPSIGQDSSHWYAGTGPVRVNIDGIGSPSTSTDDLYIRYAVRNRIATGANNSDNFPNHSLFVYLNDLNEEGGYSLFYDDNFTTNVLAPDANEAFERALLKWRCTTNVNFTIHPISEIADTSLACRISFVSLPTGTTSTLGITAITEGFCPATIIEYSRLSKFRIKFNSNFTWYTEEDTDFDLSGTGIKDLESVALHELGHAHSLKHSNNVDDLMYYTDASPPTYYNREILTNDEDGGVYMVNQSVFSDPTCATETMEWYFGDDCSGVNSILELDSQNNVSIYPNPSNGMVNIRFVEHPKQSVHLELLNLLGEQVYSVELNQLDNQLLLGELSSGIYFMRLDYSSNISQSYKLVIE